MNLLRVPGKDPADVMAWRIELRTACAQDSQVRSAVRRVCKEDPLYWLNAFCFLFEPRPRYENGVEMPKIIPFITWPHQDKVIKEICENLGKRDIGVLKSRAEGASWIGALLGLHNWLFHELSTIGVVSRNLLAADNPDDPDSVMWKVDWELTKLPIWMAGKKDVDYKRDRGKHVIKNLRNGSTIAAYAATGDVASGGRKAWMLCDELAKFGQPDDEEAMASTQYVTDSRLIVSTPKGASGAYYELMHEPSNLVKVILAWEENPTKNRGLYRFVKGKPVAVDKNNPLPPEYDPPTEQIEALFARLKRKGFNLESGVRSPWYDQECDRPRATPQAVAQELDRDFGGSSYRIFTQEVMSKVDETVCPPFRRGEMLRTSDGWQFSERSDGSVKLWCELDLQGDPPKRGYVVGCDICAGLAGSYTSNSVVQVIDNITRTQVLEFACNNMQPAEFADVAIDIAKWFHGAFLAWESNGIGGAFSSRALERRYFNLFKKPIHNQKKRVVSNKLGWYTNRETKEMMFSDLIMAIKQERLTIRCGEIIDEMNQYVRINGKIECITAVKSSVDADKGEAHGDRVMALGIALQALKERPVPVKYEDPAQPTGAEPPLGTMARRMYDAAKSMKEEAYWDDRMGHELTKSYS